MASRPEMMRVVWRDSMVLAQGGWFDPEDAPFPSGNELRHESAGFLVSDTEEGVVIAASIYLGNEEGLRVATAVFIPRSAIIDVWPLNG